MDCVGAFLVKSMIFVEDARTYKNAFIGFWYFSQALIGS